MTAVLSPPIGSHPKTSGTGKFWGFEFGAFGPLAVRWEQVNLGLPRPVRFLYASDLHLGHWWTKSVPGQLLTTVRDTRPEVILLGGDLADRLEALADLRGLIRELAALATVGAIGGNHDERTGLGEVRAAVVSGGARWLPDLSWREPLWIDSVPEPAAVPQPRILCAHYPAIFPVAVAAGYRLVLAGHLHGGQCVLATHRNQLYPAAWVHRWHGLRFTEKESFMLVSRGIADTFPFRFNCPREVLLCDLW